MLYKRVLIIYHCFEILIFNCIDIYLHSGQIICYPINKTLTRMKLNMQLIYDYYRKIRSRPS